MKRAAPEDLSSSSTKFQKKNPSPKGKATEAAKRNETILRFRPIFAYQDPPCEGEDPPHPKVVACQVIIARYVFRLFFNNLSLTKYIT